MYIFAYACTLCSNLYDIVLLLYYDIVQLKFLGIAMAIVLLLFTALVSTTFTGIESKSLTKDTLEYTLKGTHMPTNRTP